MQNDQNPLLTRSSHVVLVIIGFAQKKLIKIFWSLFLIIFHFDQISMCQLCFSIETCLRNHSLRTSLSQIVPVQIVLSHPRLVWKIISQKMIISFFFRRFLLSMFASSSRAFSKSNEALHHLQVLWRLIV